MFASKYTRTYVLEGGTVVAMAPLVLRAKCVLVGELV